MQIHAKLLRCLLAVAVILEVPQALSCTAWSPVLGTVVNVIQGPGPSSFWAHAMIDPMTGLPTITYGPTFYQLPPLMQQFTYFHECAHLVEQTSNEFIPNCRALQLMRSQGLSPAQESAIASIHMNIGPLPPQYGGSGANFWQGTLQACAQGIPTPGVGSY